VAVYAALRVGLIADLPYNGADPKPQSPITMPPAEKHEKITKSGRNGIRQPAAAHNPQHTPPEQRRAESGKAAFAVRKNKYGF